MTNLMERMREELVRRNYAQNTIHTYLRVVEEFGRFVAKRLEHATADDLRRYHAYLLGDRKRAPHTCSVWRRFGFCIAKGLRRRDMREDLPYPRNYHRKLPVVLSPEEVAWLIDCARNLYHRALLITVYSCGLRRMEARARPAVERFFGAVSAPCDTDTGGPAPGIRAQY